MASQKNGVLYTGVTSDLNKRTWQHRESITDGFTAKYHVKRLVYYELHESAEAAILREKQIKKWKRLWKLELIEKMNLHWEDLWPSIATP